MPAPFRPRELRPDDLSPDPTPIPILTALGRLVTRWAHFEAIVELLIAGLLGTEPALLFPITADIAIGNRLKHLRQLGKLRLTEEHFLILDRLVRQGEEICMFRNYLIHGFWDPSSVNNGMVQVLETRPSRKSARTRQISQYCNVEYINWLISAIHHGTYLLYDFGKQLNLA